MCESSFNIVLWLTLAFSKEMQIEVEDLQYLCWMFFLKGSILKDGVYWLVYFQTVYFCVLLKIMTEASFLNSLFLQKQKQLKMKYILQILPASFGLLWLLMIASVLIRKIYLSQTVRKLDFYLAILVFAETRQ